jgi:hypothetical protein
MAQALIETLKGFTSLQDEKQLKLLDETVAAINPKDYGQDEFRALLEVFERFPEDDGFGVFWSVVHCLEACTGYESALIESVTCMPVEFNVLMVNRLINSGITQINGDSLLSVLASVKSHPSATNSTKESAQDFVNYQIKAQEHKAKKL